VRARVERFGELALLVLLAGRPTHGYELIERLPELSGEDRVDVGNLYRTLRSLEEEGLVSSEWSADLPGPTKRTYTLTDEGHDLLTSWLRAIEQLRDGLTEFLEIAQKGGDHVRKASPQAQVGVASPES
jgi:PadR family transcriptional regulator, regulatory protein PadR